MIDTNDTVVIYMIFIDYESSFDCNKNIIYCLLCMFSIQNFSLILFDYLKLRELPFQIFQISWIRQLTKRMKNMQ